VLNVWFILYDIQVYSSFVATDVSGTLMDCLHLIAYTNCAVNPVVYCLLNDRFKARVNKLAATVKWWRSGGVPGGHLQVMAGRGRTTAGAGPSLRLGLLMTRDAAVSVNIPRGGVVDATKSPTANNVIG